MKSKVIKNGKGYTLLINKRWKESMKQWYYRFDKELKYYSERFDVIKYSDNPEEANITYTLKKHTDETN